LINNLQFFSTLVDFALWAVMLQAKKLNAMLG